jgi:YHS domain-containing protein
MKMVSILVRFLLLITGLLLLRHFLAKILSPSRQPGARGNTAVTPNNMVKDPVCGMYMDSRLALRHDSREESFYFCSEECKSRYLSRSGETGGMGSSASR